MSDDFFSDVGKWWREGWQAGVELPSTGPSVGRGLFSNWFLTEREREVEELVELHARVQAMHDASELAEPDARSDAVTTILTDVFRQSSAEYDRDYLDALYDPLAELVTEEFIWFPRYDDGAIGRLEMQVRVDLREYLLRKERFYADFDNAYPTGLRILAELSASLLDDVVSDGQVEPSDEDHALQLTMAIASIVDDVPAVIDRTVNSFCHERSEVWKQELFVPVRRQLMRNLLIASGVNPDGPPSSRPFVWARDTKKASPSELVETYLQYTPLQGMLDASIPITIPDSVRLEHTHILGGTGHGKTQLLQKLIAHDLEAEGDQAPSIIVIDSQGDLIRTISSLACFDPDAASNMADRLILIDPNDVEFPVALNMFAVNQHRIETYGLADRERVLNSVIDLFEYVFSALLGAELTQKQGVVFRYLARLMLEIPNATVQTLRELMEDGRPFRAHMEKLEGSARRFFETEFFSPGFSATKKQILRRLWGVLATPAFERMFSHPENRIDLFEAMNTGKIILINTAKDLLKPDGSSIFGRFFIAKITQAALERATIPDADRRPCFVYIDEAHDYFDDTIEHLFNQARKYRVGLTIAHQNLGQLSSGLRASVMASTSLKFAGGVSASDARALAEDMRTDAEFIRSMRKRRGQSEFAAFIKNRTARALRINVQLGYLESQDQLDCDQQASLITLNRERYCSTLEEVKRYIDQSTAPAADHQGGSKTSSPMPVATNRPAASGPPHLEEPTSREVGDPVPEDAHLPPKADAYVEGLGGQQHRYFQQFVRSLGQERGFKATIEKSIEGGCGRIDIALEHESLSIAVEVSITTRSTHEQQNVEKCFRAGFDDVILLVPDRRKRDRLSREITDRLPEDQRAHFHVFGPEDVDGFLIECAAGLAATEKSVRGYRVKVTHTPATPEEAKRRRDMISRTIARSVYKDTSS